jgi:hypothetical protein
MRDLSYNISFEIDYSYISITDIKGNDLLVKKIDLI